MNKKRFFKIIFIFTIFIKCESVKVEEDFQESNDIKENDIFEILIPCYKDGEPCNDNNPCTRDDKCEDGICKGVEIEGCDDNLFCTIDLCEEEVSPCKHNLKEGFCLIDGKCYKNGDLNSHNQCEECISIVSNSKWSFDDSNSCDDKNPCTYNDHCSYGKCVGEIKDCNDKNPCTEDICDENGNCVNENIEGDCDDGNLCTLNDKCVNGKCAGETLSCNDNNPCTDDTCDGVKGCVFKFNSNECDDGNICTVGDKCFEGKCKEGDEILKCEDGNPCTDGWCVPEKGCVHIPNNASCDDGDPCFSGDICKKGKCAAGNIPLVCNDGNPCTDDVCQTKKGCVFVPNTISCDDGDPCFVGDFCMNGVCNKGSILLECMDLNPCTEDKCIPFTGCEFKALSGQPCNDYSNCTIDDKCVDGECKGIAVGCDDGNKCTDDGCDPSGGCIYTPIKSPECSPEITITYPPRAATLKGNTLITVKGKVKSPGAPVKIFKINGFSVSIQPDGSFSYNMNSKQGMNVIVADVEDKLGGGDHAVQSYYFSNLYYSVDIENPKQSMVKDGLMVFLGPDVWDDNDTSDIDDMATIMTLYVENLDINSLVKNPVTSGKYIGCSYEVHVTNIKYGKYSVDLKPINGGLYLFVKIPNFSADIKVKTCITTFKGKATADYISIKTTLDISVDGDGNINVVMKNTDVQIVGLNVQLEGVWGFLLNWIINFFEETMANQMEQKFKEQLGAMIPDAVKKALSSLALTKSFEIKPVMGGGTGVTLEVKTNISSIKFSDKGSEIGMFATVVTPKKIQHKPLGSIARASCLNPVNEVLNFPMKRQLEMALHDDFLNQIPFGMYWGGIFDFDVSGAEVGQDLSQYGITDLKLSIDFLLPPIITSCPGSGEVHIQIGDIFINEKFKLFSLPIDMDMYVSMDGEAELFVASKPGGNEIGLKLKKINFIDVEIAKLSGELKGAEEVISKLVKEKLMPKFLESFGDKAFGTFPVPSIDLSEMHPSIPPGTQIELDLQEIFRMFGYTVLSGNIK